MPQSPTTSDDLSSLLREQLEVAYGFLLKARVTSSHAREGQVEVNILDALRSVDASIEILTGVAR